MATLPPRTVTREMIANAMIIASPKRDSANPQLCAVAYTPEFGGRVVLADELEDRRAAERWLTYQRRTVGDPAEG